MKFQHRPGSPLPYMAVVIVSVMFALAQPSTSAAPESNAVALATSSSQ